VIRNVVFDIGGVLVRLRYGAFIRYLGEAGIDMTHLPAWLGKVDLEAHERGEIPAHVLLRADRGDGAQPLDPVELQRAGSTCSSARTRCSISRRDSWRSTASTAVEYRRPALEHLATRYGIGSLGHGACASYQVGRHQADDDDLPQGRVDGSHWIRLRPFSSTTFRRTWPARAVAAGTRSTITIHASRVPNCGRSAFACQRRSSRRSSSSARDTHDSGLRPVADRVERLS
jgi:hypothetical protein